MLEYGSRLEGLDFPAQQHVVSELVDWLESRGLVQPNPTTQRILERIDEVHSVAEMATAAHLSPRQLQRVLNRSLGLSPHDFLKIVRLQQTFRSADHGSYADQSHLIRSFRSATGYTPGEFARRYDV